MVSITREEQKRGKQGKAYHLQCTSLASSHEDLIPNPFPSRSVRVESRQETIANSYEHRTNKTDRKIVSQLPNYLVVSFVAQIQKMLLLPIIPEPMARKS